jgi:pimeloyl-ACP methyl ester carboxylesterase
MSEADQLEPGCDGVTQVDDEWAPDWRPVRTSVPVGNGRVVSALKWGTQEPELVLLHGGAQNAHTFDTLAIALHRPLIALDLPGHGRSSWRADWDYRPETIAFDVGRALEQLAASASMVVGMSLGGLTAAAVATRFPHLVQRLALIDVTPGVNQNNGADIRALYNGPESFPSFDAMLDHVLAIRPTFDERSLRRGVFYNARLREDGRWVWRHHRSKHGVVRVEPDFTILWSELASIRAPIWLFWGRNSEIIGQAEVDEFVLRVPTATVVAVEDAGHSVHRHQPDRLAEFLAAGMDEPWPKQAIDDET